MVVFAGLTAETEIIGEQNISAIAASVNIGFSAVLHTAN